MNRTKIILTIGSLVFIFFAFQGRQLFESGFLTPLSNPSNGRVLPDEHKIKTTPLVPIASLHQPRAAHTATLLKDGTVLICGGFAGSSSNALSSAEIFNPSTKLFTTISSLKTPRVGHSATLLPDGKVLIAGGYNGDYLFTTEIYDPKSKAFSPGPRLKDARHGHTATVLNSDKIILIGGVGTGWTFLSSAEIYDVKTGQFSKTNPMSFARESHTATLLENGNVLVTGGHQGRRENVMIYANSEIYDVDADQFFNAGDMSIPRRKHDAVLLSNGKVLINGGSDFRDSIFSSAEIYDPIKKQFIAITSMIYPRYKHKNMSILLADNNVLIGGGSNKAEIFNVTDERFTPLNGDLGSTRLFSSATLLANGEVLITGGYDENIAAINKASLYSSDL